MHSVEAIAGLGSNSKHAKSPPSPTLPTPAPAPAPAYRPSKSFQAPTFAHDPTQIHIPPADDPLLAYLTARIQTHGERSKAARHTSRILLHLHAFTRRPPLPILREAIERASPAVRIINIKKSMKSVAHPVALSEKQRAWRGIEHMIVAAKQRNESEFAERFARVALDVLKGDRDKEKISLALKAKIQIHGMAVVNRYGFSDPFQFNYSAILCWILILFIYRGNVFKKMT